MADLNSINAESNFFVNEAVNSVGNFNAADHNDMGLVSENPALVEQFSNYGMENAFQVVNDVPLLQRTEMVSEFPVRIEQYSDADNDRVEHAIQLVSAAVPLQPQLPRMFTVPVQYEPAQAAPLFMMPTRPVIPNQITTVVSGPPPQQVTTVVGAALPLPMTTVVSAPVYQYLPRPQFQQMPGPQYYQNMQNMQQPHSNLAIRPMGMQMHSSMGIPYGAATNLIPPVVVGDPMNDMASWSEHEAEDKRKYWYNRVNGTSTYDKPFCLKTPEERSIPHCKWKEYTSADDKKYYSDGKESSWTVPEEYRVWKEKMDAVESKKLLALQAASLIQKSSSSSSKFTNSSSRSENDSSVPSSGRRKQMEMDDKPAPSYASQAEATDAFKNMLVDKKILTTMKMKEVTDLCQNDVRFRALRSAGERKQALAEYQTRTLKLEKEALKSKARKSRDLFLIMLAENTVIDARTRWREACSLLQEDVRFKSVEDSRDREDLFNDFVSELEKKEKEDRVKQKNDALKHLEGVLEARRETGAISRRSTWTEERDGLLKNPVLHALDDSEVKRIFQDFVGRLDFTYKEEERQRKVELQRRFDVLTVEFRDLLEKLAYEGEITAASRWSECCVKPCIAQSAAYRELEILSNVERKEGVVTGCSARDTFEKLLVAVREASRADKRLVQDVLRDWEVEVRHTTTLQEFIDAVYTAAGVKTTPQLNTAPVVCDIAALTEDGEEVEEEDHVLDNGRVGFGKLLRSMLAKRPLALENIFSDLIEEEKRRQAKRESNFIRLLDEYYFESPNDTWEGCKRAISRHPAYLDMMKIDREKVYQTFSASRLISKAKRKDERSRSRERESDRTLDRDSKTKEKKHYEEDSVRNHDGTYGISSSTVSNDHHKDFGSIDSTVNNSHIKLTVNHDRKDVRVDGNFDGKNETRNDGRIEGESDEKNNSFLGKREMGCVENSIEHLEDGESDETDIKKRKTDLTT